MIILSFLMWFDSHGQKLAVTESGDTIKIFKNRTWKPIKLRRDSRKLLGKVKTKVKVDQFDNSKTITTDSWLEFAADKGNYTVNASMGKFEDYTYLKLAYSGDLGCLSQHSSMLKVKLSSGDIVEWLQISNTICGQTAYANFVPVTQQDMKKQKEDFDEIISHNLGLLEAYDWETIRIIGSDHYTDVFPSTTKKLNNPEQFFRQHLAAIANE